MFSKIKSFAAAGALWWALGAQGAALFTQAPVAGPGVQSDPTILGAPFSQPFSVAPGSVVQSVVWWGLNEDDAAPGVPDEFLVLINGLPVSGLFSSVPVQGQTYTEYTLDIDPDLLLTSSVGTISIAMNLVNDDGDALRSWIWQGAETPAPGTRVRRTAFRLDGIPGQVPVPGTALLVALGLGLAGWRRFTPR